MKFLTHQLDKAFKNHLKGAKRVDIAVAWVTESCPVIKDNSLYEAVKNGAYLRFITGLDEHNGTITSPSVLNNLLELQSFPGRGRCELYVYEGKKSGKFHPKVFLFHKKSGRQLCWIGSANMTWPAFRGTNEEAVHEFVDTGDVEKWFKKILPKHGKQYVKKIERKIHEYEKKYIENRCKPPKREERAIWKNSQHPRSLMKDCMKWGDFANLLHYTDKWWRENREDTKWIGVHDDDLLKSYIRVINRGKSPIKATNWKKLNDEDRHMLCGFGKENALLGDLGRFVYRDVFSNNSVMHEINKHIKKIVNNRQKTTIPHLTSILEDMLDIDGVGIATATRLLALAAPDIAITAAGKPPVRENLVRLVGRDNLIKLTGYHNLPRSVVDLKIQNFIYANKKQSRIKKDLSEIYGGILKWIHQQPWHKVPSSDVPNDEKKIWRVRASLLDIFVYDYKK